MGEVQYSKASGQDLIRVVGLIDDVVAGEPANHVAMACLAIAITCQQSNIEPESLAEGIKGCSEWIACFLTSVNDDIDKKELN